MYKAVFSYLLLILTLLQPVISISSNGKDQPKHAESEELCSLSLLSDGDKDEICSKEEVGQISSPVSVAVGKNIHEAIDSRYLKKYLEWKNEFLSTETGRMQWEAYEARPDFKLTITVSKSHGKGAEVVGYKWNESGKLVAATIVLGHEIDSGFPSPVNYPITSSLNAGVYPVNRTPLTRIDSKVLAAVKLFHEFGHINRTASYDGKLYQLQNELIPRYNNLFFSSSGTSPQLAILEKIMMGTPVSIKQDRELAAEANTIPYLLERYPESMPSRVKKAIKTFLESYSGTI
jgi:hypothetical protein